jgi:hypothetical protein
MTARHGLRRRIRLLGRWAALLGFQRMRQAACRLRQWWRAGLAGCWGWWCQAERGCSRGRSRVGRGGFHGRGRGGRGSPRLGGFWGRVPRSTAVGWGGQLRSCEAVGVIGGQDAFDCLGAGPASCQPVGFNRDTPNWSTIASTMWGIDHPCARPSARSLAISSSSSRSFLEAIAGPSVG